MLKAAAEFSGVKVLTYCFMENHFHLLVRVPANDSVSDAVLVRRYRALHPQPNPLQPLSADNLERILVQGGAEAEVVRRKLVDRMGSLSEFMKTLKQRFSLWFNRTHQRFGPVWSDRYKSLLVQGDSRSLLTVAAYIDLNPVRAGIVADPRDYPNSCYGRAIRGGVFEREGLRALLPKRAVSLRRYRDVLFSKDRPTTAGSSLKSTNPSSLNLPSGKLLLTRQPAFTSGRVLGSLEYLQKVCSLFRSEMKFEISARGPTALVGFDNLFVGVRVRKTRRIGLGDRMS